MDETEADGLPSIELRPHQADELFDDVHALIAHVGGRGSGKTKIDGHHFLRYSGMYTDGVYALFANTYSQLHGAILPPIIDMLAEAGIDHVYENKAPAEWRKEWKRNHIETPKPWLRSIKLWIWENGVHIFLGTLAGRAWTRVKSFEIIMAVVEEFTEQGVPKELLTYLLGSVRCGRGKKCHHQHKIVLKGNVPLNNPSHWSFKFIETQLAQEEERKREGKPPFFRFIQSSTSDNPHLDDGFTDRLKEALDPETYLSQTSGIMNRNAGMVCYHQFSQHNILQTIDYDPNGPLDVWFDWNVRPSVAGWGQPLGLDQVPPAYLRSDAEYFGISGEWFSEDPMTTEQLMHALCEDPTGDERCVECDSHSCKSLISNHVETGDGLLCRSCARFCSGDVLRYQWSKKPLHAAPNWRGLMRHRGPINVFCDATGGASHADAQVLGGSIGIMRDILSANLGRRVHFLIKSSNPAVSMRLLAVNRGFCMANGTRRVFVAKWCVAHISDFREVLPDPKTGKPIKVAVNAKNIQSDDRWKLTHMSDAFGYRQEYRSPAVIPHASIPGTIANSSEGGPSFIDLERDEDQWK